jgi:mono/diheme cytochrome c family protein
MKKLILLACVLATTAALSARAADAKATYEKECAKCHGPDGKGDTKMGKKLSVKDYTDAKVQDALKDDKAFKSIKEGIKEGESTKMKAFAESITDDEIKALVKHMRTFKK